jgi:hypothetical protein
MEISKVIEEINTLLTVLCKYNKETDKELAKIQFPKGVITSVYQYKIGMPFITDEVLQRNLAYHCMLDDVFTWLLRHFAFYAVVKEMVIKIAIANIGNMMEAITQHIVKQFQSDKPVVLFSNIIAILSKRINCLRKRKKDRIGTRKGLSKLVSNKIITNNLKKEVMGVWGVRCKQHLESLKKREFNIYNTDDYREAIKIWINFNKQLFESCEKDLIKGSENILRGF